MLLSVELDTGHGAADIPKSGSGRLGAHRLPSALIPPSHLQPNTPIHAKKIWQQQMLQGSSLSGLDVLLELRLCACVFCKTCKGLVKGSSVACLKARAALA